jgi:hypothetical protein
MGLLDRPLSRAFAGDDEFENQASEDKTLATCIYPALAR